ARPGGGVRHGAAQGPPAGPAQRVGRENRAEVPLAPEDRLRTARSMETHAPTTASARCWGSSLATAERTGQGEHAPPAAASLETAAPITSAICDWARGSMPARTSTIVAKAMSARNSTRDANRHSEYNYASTRGLRQRPTVGSACRLGGVPN